VEEDQSWTEFKGIGLDDKEFARLATFNS